MSATSCVLDSLGWLDREEPYDGLLLVDGANNLLAVRDLAPDLPVVALIPGPRDLGAVPAGIPVVWVWMDRGPDCEQVCDALWAAGVADVRLLPEQADAPDGDGPMDARDLLRLGGPDDGRKWLQDMLAEAETVPRPFPVSEAPDGCYRLLSGPDLLAMPDPEWLIDGLLPASGLAALFGPPKSLKSFMAFSFAMSVATGRPWLGRKVKPRWVVYVAAEGWGGLKARYRAWMEENGWPDVERMRFLPEAVNLLDPALVEKVSRTLASLPEGPGLLVVDTMARTMLGGDENSARDVGLFIDAVDRLRAGNLSLVVHHSGLDESRERGSSALRGALDLRMKMNRDGKTLRAVLSCEDLKDAAEWDPISLALEPVADSLVVRLREEDGEDARGRPARSGLADQIKEVVRSATEPMSRPDIARAVGRNPKDATLRRAVDDLIEAGILVRTGRLITFPGGVKKPDDTPDTPRAPGEGVSGPLSVGGAARDTPGVNGGEVAS